MNDISVTFSRRNGSPETPPSAQHERIRLAAVQLFRRQGFAGTSMKQLAKTLNMATGNLYNYFPNKEAILFDVLEHQLLATLSRDREIVATENPPADTLRLLARDLVARDLNDPVAAFVGIQGLRGLSDEHVVYFSKLMAEIRALWVSVIADGAAQGVFVVNDQKLCALSVLTLCSSVSTWFRPEGEYSAEYVADHVADMVLRMTGCS